MNIALFSDTYYPEINGVATSVHSLFTLLNKMGHNCYVITTTNSKFTTFKDKVIGIPGLTLKRLYGYRAAFIFNNKAFKLIKSLNLDVIHVNTEFGIGIFGSTVASKLDIPLVYTYHTMYEDYTYYATKGYFDRFSKWAIREISRSNIANATEIIVPSQKTEIYFRSIGIGKTINIVPTGFDFSRFNLNDEQKNESFLIKEKLGIKNKKVLLCLGRLAQEKSFDIIIKGYKKYLEKYKDMSTILLFVGAGPDENNLKSLVQNFHLEDRVLFTGKVKLDYVPLYYHMADLFLNASISETQGLTFMEAMAAKIPILARFDNNLINVINDNETGFFFQDIEDFPDKLNSILNKDKKELGYIIDNAFASIEPFSENVFYDNIMGVYNRAIKRNW